MPAKSKTLTEPSSRFKKDALAIVAKAPALDSWIETKALKTEDEFHQAANALSVVKKVRRDLLVHVNKIKKPLNAARTALIAQHKKSDAPFAALEGYIKTKLLNPYMDKQRKKEEKKAERRATKLDAAGSSDAAQDVRDSVDNIDFTMDVRGMSRRDHWTYETPDLMMLVKAVAAGKAPLAALEVCHTFLADKARALKQEGEMYPGVQVVNRPVVAMRSGK